MRWVRWILSPTTTVAASTASVLATDIVESSAKAMVHVLNNIWRAAEVEKELQRKAQHNENNKETV